MDMNVSNEKLTDKRPSRRAFPGGALAGGAMLALPACSTLPGFSFTEAIRANPDETRDPLIIGVFGAGNAF